MKKTASFILLFIAFGTVFCQNADIMSRLKKEYPSVKYVDEANVYEVLTSMTPPYEFGLYDGRGNVVFPTGQYKHVSYDCNNGITSGYIVTPEYFGPKGYCDTNGNMIIKPEKYSYIYPNRDLVTNRLYGFNVMTGHLRGYLDPSGNVIVEPDKYNEVYPEFDNTCEPPRIRGFMVRIGKKTGFLNAAQQTIIEPCEYTAIRPNYLYKGVFAPPVALIECLYVYIDKSIGVCDTNGRIIIPVGRYDKIYYSRNTYSHGLRPYYFRVEKGGRTGLCDANGDEVLKPDRYDKLGFWAHTGCLWVERGGKHGVCDSTFREIIECKYDKYVQIYNDGERFVGTRNGRDYLINPDGSEITSYKKICMPAEGLCMVVNDKNKCGYISAETGEVVIPLQYDTASAFADGVAMVVHKGKTTLLPNPLTIVTDNAPRPAGKAVSTFPAADSDVDRQIPDGRKADGNTYAFIVANENYPSAKVPYALNDGWTFEKYCRKTLGIQDKNIFLFEDATGGQIIGCVEQMKSVARECNGNATIIFYYAGHAFPDEESKNAYLMPVDGDSKNSRTGYGLERLYKELGSVQTRQVVCFIDACFSGATRDDKLILTGRGVAITVKDDIPQGNMVVMTSATGAETAHQYEEMHHGMFTYYLLQKLQETNGDVTLGELSSFVTKMVKRKSVIINQKMQTPTVIPSPKLQATWQTLKLN